MKNIKILIILILFNVNASFASIRILPIIATLNDEDLQFCIDSHYGDDEGAGKITTIILTEYKDNYEYVPLWSLEGPSTEVGFVKCFKYGNKLNGLIETISPSILEIDVVYKLTVQSSGEVGFYTFKIIEKESGCKKLIRID